MRFQTTVLRQVFSRLRVIGWGSGLAFCLLRQPCDSDWARAAKEGRHVETTKARKSGCAVFHEAEGHVLPFAC